MKTGDKIATVIFRAIIFSLGILLIVGFFKIWKKAGIRGWIAFAALIGLFIGYGIGGDIWGARFFDFFTGQNTRSQVGTRVEAGTIKIKKPAKAVTWITWIGWVVVIIAFILLVIRNHHHSH